MKRSRRLAEEPARIPDARQAHWDQAIPQYLREVGQLHNESARSHRFAMLVQELLGIEPGLVEAYGAGIERSLQVKQKDRILRGRADNLFGNILIEFERDASKHREEAEEQLRRYLAILWSQEHPTAQTPYLAIVTDGVRFVTYTPSVIDPARAEVMAEGVRLDVLEEVNWERLTPCEAVYWLDRYFLRREVLAPTTDRVVADFGLRSHAFRAATNSLLTQWEQVRQKSSFAVVYESWQKYLRIVYGTQVAADELFVRHTYLATLAKVMAWMRIAESQSLPDNAQIVAMLDGELFKRYGIQNFLEEDFFSWLARPETMEAGLGLVRWLFSLLQSYNLRQLSEDVLKSLYQELVDPETRHDLGEFYTPDWLAHRIVRKLLDKNPKGSVFDPACGSGTFLYLAIREKRQRLGQTQGTLRHILESVCGADIHPLAVIIAKTNYILGLGDLLRIRKGQVAIPIYLADTVRLPEREVTPELWMDLPSYRVELDGCVIHLPEVLLRDPAAYDQGIDLAREFAVQNKGRVLDSGEFADFLSARRFPRAGDPLFAKALFTIAEGLKQFIDADRDTIWAFVLKNIYKPLFIQRRFDFVLGNPPWIAFRFLERAYQEFLKRQIVKEYRLLKPRAEQLPNLEIGTLFLVRSADLYLKSGGTIAFVLPRSVFNADQHYGLRAHTFRLADDPRQNLACRELWDCYQVEPVFKVPACVLFAQKSEAPRGDVPLAGEILSGHLASRNASLAEAETRLNSCAVSFALHVQGGRSFWGTGLPGQQWEASPYKTEFARGVNAVLPHPFWLVDVTPSAPGFDPEAPPLETSEWARAGAKAAYKGLHLRGTVESRFLFSTLLSSDLIPFGTVQCRLVVAPVERREGAFRILTASEAHRRGFLHLAKWLAMAEEEWGLRRGAKAERMSLYEYLDLFGGITNQNPRAKHLVVYNKSGTFLTAAVIQNGPRHFPIGGQSVCAQAFISDQTLYYFPTDDAGEADYLAAFLNAPEVDRRIKPMMNLGLWGPRDIHKKPLELPIPRFDAGVQSHRDLADLAKRCRLRVGRWLEGPGHQGIKSIGKLRSLVRQFLSEDLAAIDGLVKSIVGS